MSKYQFSVEVQARHLPEHSDPQQPVYAFAYTVTVRNTGQVTAQLIARHWHIHDASGQVEEVQGLGVVGQQPLLRPGQGFEYTSGCRLRTASGSMHGSYFCVAEDGTRFEAPIALFVLDASAHAADSGTRVLH